MALLAGLADVRHGAVVVEDRYSQLFKLTHVRPAVVTTQLAEAAVRCPMVPIVFAETRQLAQEWSLRFFGAALETVGAQHVRDLQSAPAAARSVGSGSESVGSRCWIPGRSSWTHSSRSVVGVSPGPRDALTSQSGGGRPVARRSSRLSSSTRS